jgi:hypothetical protein
MILVRNRRAEEGNDSVAKELVDRSLVPVQSARISSLDVPRAEGAETGGPSAPSAADGL